MFCDHTSSIIEPLTRLLKKHEPFVMGPEQHKAFKALKVLATTALTLCFFIPGLPTQVETDLLYNATRGVIMQ